MRAFILLILSVSLAACGQGDARIEIANAEFRAPLGASGIGVAYFDIRSNSGDRIVKVSSSHADAVEIHASVTKGGATTMQRLDGVDLPEGETVAFETGGLHLMVFSPRPTGSDETFPITIELQSGARQEVQFRRIAAGSGG